MTDSLTILEGDALSQLRELEAESVQACVTSPPYWGLRDYGHVRQIGLEATPDLYVAHLVEVFAEVKRVLRSDATLWLNLGDTFFGDAPTRTDSSRNGGKRRSKARIQDLKPKDLVGIPWLVAFALRANGWWLRSDIVWAKPNVMPESVKDRPTRAHEFVFLLTKSPRYYYNAEAIVERANYDGRTKTMFEGGVKYQDDAQYMPHEKANTSSFTGHERWRCDGNGQHIRNARSVWHIANEGFEGAHFATFPTRLPRRCILAGSKPGDVILDPFAGSGTTGKVALELGRKAILIEAKREYIAMIEERCRHTTVGLPFG